MKQTFADPYFYPGTNVLRNLLHLTDRSSLELAETRIVGLRVDELFQSPPKPPYDLRKLLWIHGTLFGEVYPWAGKLREHTGRMTKVRPNGSTVIYCDSAYVPTQIALVFEKLVAESNLVGLAQDDFAQRAAYFYGELDAVHPVREGNSRTLRLFFYGLAQTAGFHMDWSILAENNQREELYAARDLAVMLGDSAPLAALFASILTRL